jgi:hypothetical protein
LNDYTGFYAYHVDQFNIYLMHDAMEETLDAYGEEIIPALEAKSAA